MPRRTRIDLHDVASWPNLHRAFHLAARGKRQRPEVRRFESRLDPFSVLDPVRDHLAELGLHIKPNMQLQKSEQGLTLCGFRVFPGILRLTRRRQRRFLAARHRWESAFETGDIDARALQQGIDSAIAVTFGADATAWRRESFRRQPPPDA